MTEDTGEPRVKCVKCRTAWVDQSVMTCEACDKRQLAKMRARDREYVRSLRAFAKAVPLHHDTARAQAQLVVDEWKQYDATGHWPVTPLHVAGFDAAAHARWVRSMRPEPPPLDAGADV